MDILSVFNIIAQVQATVPQVAPAPQINYTLLLTVASMSIAAMATFIKIYGREVKKEELPGDENTYCKAHMKDFDRVEKKSEANEKASTDIKTVIGEMKITLAKLESEMSNTTNTITEIKVDNKELAQKLEVLIGRLLDYMSEE